MPFLVEMGMKLLFVGAGAMMLWVPLLVWFWYISHGWLPFAGIVGVGVGVGVAGVGGVGLGAGVGVGGLGTYVTIFEDTLETGVGKERPVGWKMGGSTGMWWKLLM